MAPVPTSSFGWQLFKKLVMTCQESNPAGEVDARAIVPLPRDRFARGHASHPLDTECGKVPHNAELVHVGE
jgi:hypothetical protein